jgi:hypothetical protein
MFLMLVVLRYLKGTKTTSLIRDQETMILCKKETEALGMISHTCNPIYSRSRDLGDGNSRLAWKKVK